MVKIKKPVKFDVFQIPKRGKPLKIVRGLNLRQARNVVRNARTGKNFFVGFEKSGKKVTRTSSFRTTK